jgi:hypothetical protein
MHRNHRGYGKTLYQNTSGRNDFVTAKGATPAGSLLRNPSAGIPQRPSKVIAVTPISP